jgi:Protein of unknown function (DUF3828)
MPRLLPALALLLLAALGLPALGRAQDLPAARAFVQQLYSAYEHPAKAGPDVLGKSATHIFSPSLLQLIHRDQARTPKGDAPALDGDPICDCQDPDGLHLVSLAVNPVDSTHASAIATLHFPGESKPSLITLSLLATPAGWRVDDVATADTPSLRKFLQTAH